MEKQTNTNAQHQSSLEAPVRRNWPAFGLVAALLVVAVGSVGWWIGSNDGATSGNRASVETTVVHQWSDAMKSGDADLLADLYAEDGVWECVPIDHNFSGPTAVRSTLTDVFKHASFMEMKLQRAVEEDGLIMTEWTWSGMSSTHARAASDQTPFSTGVAVIFEIDEELIKRSSLYYDYDQLFN